MSNYNNKKNKMLLGAIAVVMLGITSIATWSAHNFERNDYHEKFVMLANGRIDKLSTKLSNLKNIELEGLATFYDASEEVTPAEFKKYSDHLLKNNSIQAWEWIEAVLEKDKNSFEQSMRKSGVHNFSIGEKNNLGERVPVSGRDRYFPVLHINPLKGNEKALGYDLGSEPLRRRALIEAIETGSVIATEAIILVQESGKQKGMLVYFPVYSKVDTSKVRGFALAVLRIGSLLESIGSHAGVHMELKILQDYGEPELLGKTFDDARPNNEFEISFQQNLAYFGKTFVISAYAGEEFMRLHPKRLGWLVGVFGFLLTLVLLVIVGQGVRRRQELEYQIEVRTGDLLDVKERFELLAEQSQTITWEIDENGFFVFMSNTVKDVLGYSPEQIIGKKYFYEMFTINNLNELTNTYRELSNKKESFVNMENVSTTLQGNEIWFSTNGIPKLDENGKLLGYRGTYSDITERKTAQIAQDELRTALDSHCIVAITDLRGEITFVNDKFCDISKYTREELLGQNHRLICSGHHPKSFFENLWNTILGGSTWKGEVKNRAKDGSFYWMQSTIVPFLNAEGKPRQFVAIRTDITERKRAELELEASKELAETANNAKSEFLANMSHEIRTPMNAIIGLSSLTLETDLSDLQRDSLKKIYYSSKMLLGIINDVLDYSKIEAGKLELDTHEFSIDDILNQIRVLFGTAVDEKGLELYFKVPSQLPQFLRGDSLRLGQVFINLIGNAIKFTEKGRVELEVMYLSGDEKEVQLRFKINDTGIGLALDEQQKLFKAFSQADTSTTRKFGGTGLGLVISSKLVQAMGGVLTVTSEAGEGSSFSFDISLMVSKGTEVTQYQSELSNKHLKILVVDDQEIARAVITNILNSWNAHVTEVTNGKDAVNAVVEAEKINKPYDVILMDWKMPGVLDGVEAIDKISQLRTSGTLGGRETPAVVVSAYQRKDIPMGVVPINGFIQKPITKSLLYDALVEAVGAQQSGTFTSQDVIIPLFKDSSVLLVEDNELNQEVAQRWIGKTGVTLSIANNGQEAVDIIDTHEFDLVLMDLQMPVMDGFEATRVIRKTYPDLPIIALSAAVLETDRQKSSDAGMNGHLGKPIDERDLYQVMLRWLKKSSNGEKNSSDEIAMIEPVQKLDGFDVSRGLRSSDNDPRFYKKLLHGFKKQLKNEFQNIGARIHGGDDAVKDLIHTLKGIAGTVGATDVERLSILIDGAYQSNDEISSEVITQLESAIAGVERSLENLSLETQDETPVSIDQGKALIQTILKALQRSELVAGNDLAQLSSFINSVLGEGAADDIVALIEAYEHEKAFVKLTTIEKNIEGTMS